MREENPNYRSLMPTREERFVTNSFKIVLSYALFLLFLYFSRKRVRSGWLSSASFLYPDCWQLSLSVKTWGLSPFSSGPAAPPPISSSSPHPTRDCLFLEKRSFPPKLRPAGEKEKERRRDTLFLSVYITMQLPLLPFPCCSLACPLTPVPFLFPPPSFPPRPSYL